MVKKTLRQLAGEKQDADRPSAKYRSWNPDLGAERSRNPDLGVAQAKKRSRKTDLGVERSRNPDLGRRRLGKLKASMPGRRARHQAAEPSQSPGPCYMCYMCYMALTKQATEHPLSPGSLLYVLYVLYGIEACILYT